MIIADSNWDSTFFHKSILSVTLEAQDTIDQWEQLLTQNSADLIYLKYEDDLSIAQKNFLRLQKTDLSVTNVIYKKQPRKKDIQEEKAIKIISSANDSLYSMVLDCGKFSRFYLDPNLRNDYPRLYRQWLENAFTKKNWHCITFSEESEPEGFCVFSKSSDNAGHIELLMVKEQSRRKQIGQRLIQAAENALLQMYAISDFFVATQENNIPACHCYEKSNFTLHKKIHIHHLWRKK